MSESEVTDPCQYLQRRKSTSLANTSATLSLAAGSVSLAERLVTLLGFSQLPTAFHWQFSLSKSSTPGPFGMVNDAQGRGNATIFIPTGN